MSFCFICASRKKRRKRRRSEGKRCHYCGKRFKKLLSHFREVHPELTMLECAACGAEFIFKRQMMQHWISKHSSVHKCHECGVGFNTLNAVTRHMFLQHKDAISALPTALSEGPLLAYAN
jgi:ribosomal protein L34E